MAKKNLIITRYAALVAGLVLFVALAAPAYGQANANDLIIAIRYERGVHCYKQRNYEQAIQEFQRILELNPAHQRAEKYLAASKKQRTKKTVHELYGQAEAYYKQREYQKAIDAYQDVLTIMENDGYSMYNLEILKARIEKTERQKRERRSQTIERLDRDIAEKKSRENQRRAQELALQEQQQRITEIKSHVDETVAEQYREEEKSLVMATALREAEDAVAQKDRRISELITAIPQETMDEGFSLLQGLSAQEKAKRAQRTYGVAKDYYRQKDYVRAVEAFQQVIVLEENARRKRYSVHAARYIRRANSQLKSIMKKELSKAD